jgi:cysteine desulfurase/selenocysteine lyase
VVLLELGCDVSPPKNRRAGILTMLPPAGEVDVLLERIHEAGFRVSFRRGRIRVAPHFYTTREEIDGFANVVRTFVG